MSEDQLALAAALAGVATVDLGGAGAGRYLHEGIGAGAADFSQRAMAGRDDGPGRYDDPSVNGRGAAD